MVIDTYLRYFYKDCWLCTSANEEEPDKISGRNARFRIQFPNSLRRIWRCYIAGFLYYIAKLHQFGLLFVGHLPALFALRTRFFSRLHFIFYFLFLFPFALSNSVCLFNLSLTTSQYNWPELLLYLCIFIPQECNDN